MNKKNTPLESFIISIAITIALSIFTSQALAKEPKPKDKITPPPKKQIAITCPFFLRTCLENLIREFQKNTKGLQVIVINKKNRAEQQQAPESLLHFTFIKNYHPETLESNSSKQEKGSFESIGRIPLAIFVNNQNPLKGLTIPQIDSIFSKNRRCGFPFDIHNFGQLGLTGKWMNSEIESLGPAPYPYLIGWFKNDCLCQGTFKEDVKLLATKVDLFKAISTQTEAIGFYIFTGNEKGIRPVAISLEEGKDYFLPSPDKINSGDYPLVATVGIRYQKKGLQQEESSFLNFCLSKKGQKILLSCGITPLYPKGYREKK